MEDEYRWKHLDEDVLARIAQAGRANLHGLRLWDVCKCISKSEYRIWL
jgi:hypothetical protein